VGPQRFRFATVAGDTGVERDETCARLRFLPVASTSPRRSSPPVRRPMHRLKFVAVAKVEAVRPVHLAELLHLPEASAISLSMKRSSCGPPTTAWPPGAICRIMNLLPLQAPMVSAHALGRAQKLRAGRGNVLQHWDGVAVDRRGKRKRRNRPGVCLALGVATNSPSWAASSGPAIAEAESVTRPTLIANKIILASGSLHIVTMVEAAGEQEFRSVSKPPDASAASPCLAGDGRRDSRSRAHKTFEER
jgi:hypothetical protein